ncbi:MAG: thioredoxin family protein [bacterium]|nr:thioredoxin family protein [bacterium]
MGNPALGLGVVAAVILVAAGAAYLLRRNTAFHPLIDVSGLGLPAGIVVFTSTDCPRCKDALAVARRVDAPLREVTYEIESDLQERAGVIGVPLTLVIDDSGTSVAQFAGQLSERSLRKALAGAGL